MNKWITIWRCNSGSYAVLSRIWILMDLRVFCAIFLGEKCACAIFYALSKSATRVKFHFGNVLVVQFKSYYFGILVISTNLNQYQIRNEHGSTTIALCSYPLKLEIQKFGKVKAQFSLNFVPNFKISVLTGKELCKIWGKNIFFWIFCQKCVIWSQKTCCWCQANLKFCIDANYVML